MDDDVRLQEELHRIKQLINSDRSILEQFDADGSGRIDGEQWESVRRLVAERLEQRVVGTRGEPNAEGGGVLTITDPVPPGEIAREVFERELAADPSRDLPPRIDACDELVLENHNHGLASSERQRHDYAIFTTDKRRLGTIEQIECEFAAKTRYGDRLSRHELWFTVRPHNGDIVRIKRTAAFIGESLEVQSIFGRMMARVTWRPFCWGYHYRVLSENSRVLNVDGRNAGDFEMDISEGGKPVGTIEYNRRLEDKEVLEPKVVSEGEPQSFAQRVIRVGPGRVTPSLRWGLLATAMFADRPPSLFSGWFRHLIGDRR